MRSPTRSTAARSAATPSRAAHGRLCLSGRDGRQPVFARTDQWSGWNATAPAEAAGAVVNRYRAGYGDDAGADGFAAWAGIAKSHARRLWALAGTAPPTKHGALTGVRLVGPGDPLLQSRDREALLPDPAVRKKLWSAIPTTGLVLVDGEAAGLWKAKKAGKRLDVTVETFGDLPIADVEAEAERLAPHRGCTSAQVSPS